MILFMKRYLLIVLFMSLIVSTPFDMIAQRSTKSSNNQKGVDSKEHEYVDLGLPSGTMWATMNVGATKPEDYGHYFAWGETSPKHIYSFNNYKWYIKGEFELTKYCTTSTDGYRGFVDNKTELDLADDAAYVNWGKEWRMPSLQQVKELLKYTTSKWITKNRVNGFLLTSKRNGATLFLPAVGWIYDSKLNDAGMHGFYWTRTLCVGNELVGERWAGIIDLDQIGVDWGYSERDVGHCVRAVRISKKKQLP